MGDEALGDVPKVGGPQRRQIGVSLGSSSPHRMHFIVSPGAAILRHSGTTGPR
jgi:hypothetical protein